MFNLVIKMQEKQLSQTEEQKETVNNVAPFGYRMEKDKPVLDETEAPIRKLMYELFSEHQRKKTVARLLNERGFRTRSGARFSDMAVDRLLRDPSAKGIYQTSRRKTSRKSKVISIEPIVSVELWDQVNAMLESGQRLGKKAVQLFAGFVYCKCDGKMSVPSNSPKYICSNCRRKIVTDDLEEIFGSQLKAFRIWPEATQDQAEMTDSSSTTPSLADFWGDLTGDEKRVIVEQIVNRIVVAERDIQIEFGLAPDSLETVAIGQQEKATSIEQAKESGLISSETQQITNINEPLMNETQAAKFLGISRMTLLRKRNSSEIKFFRVGFRVLYSKEKHLVPFLERCEQKAEKE